MADRSRDGREWQRSRERRRSRERSPHAPSRGRDSGGGGARERRRSPVRGRTPDPATRTVACTRENMQLLLSNVDDMMRLVEVERLLVAHNRRARLDPGLTVVKGLLVLFKYQTYHLGAVVRHMVEEGEDMIVVQGGDNRASTVIGVVNVSSRNPLADPDWSEYGQAELERLADYMRQTDGSMRLDEVAQAACRRQAALKWYGRYCEEDDMVRNLPRLVTSLQDREEVQRTASQFELERQRRRSPPPVERQRREESVHLQSQRRQRLDEPQRREGASELLRQRRDEPQLERQRQQREVEPAPLRKQREPDSPPRKQQQYRREVLVQAGAGPASEPQPSASLVSQPSGGLGSRPALGTVADAAGMAALADAINSISQLPPHLVREQRQSQLQRLPPDGLSGADLPLPPHLMSTVAAQPQLQPMVSVFQRQLPSVPLPAHQDAAAAIGASSVAPLNSLAPVDQFVQPHQPLQQQQPAPVPMRRVAPSSGGSGSSSRHQQQERQAKQHAAAQQYPRQAAPELASAELPAAPSAANLAPAAGDDDSSKPAVRSEAAGEETAASAAGKRKRPPIQWQPQEMKPGDRPLQAPEAPATSKPQSLAAAAALAGGPKSKQQKVMKESSAAAGAAKMPNSKQQQKAAAPTFNITFSNAPPPRTTPPLGEGELLVEAAPAGAELAGAGAFNIAGSAGGGGSQQGRNPSSRAHTDRGSSGLAVHVQAPAGEPADASGSQGRRQQRGSTPPSTAAAPHREAQPPASGFVTSPAFPPGFCVGSESAGAGMADPDRPERSSWEAGYAADGGRGGGGDSDGIADGDGLTFRVRLPAADASAGILDDHGGYQSEARGAVGASAGTLAGRFDSLAARRLETLRARSGQRSDAAAVLASAPVQYSFTAAGMADSNIDLAVAAQHLLPPPPLAQQPALLAAPLAEVVDVYGNRYNAAAAIAALVAAGQPAAALAYDEQLQQQQQAALISEQQPLQQGGSYQQHSGDSSYQQQVVRFAPPAAAAVGGPGIGGPEPAAAGYGGGDGYSLQADEAPMAEGVSPPGFGRHVSRVASGTGRMVHIERRDRAPAGGSSGGRRAVEAAAAAGGGSDGGGSGARGHDAFWEPCAAWESEVVEVLQGRAAGGRLLELHRTHPLPPCWSQSFGAFLTYLQRRKQLFVVHLSQQGPEHSTVTPAKGARAFLQYKRRLLQFLADHRPRVPLEALWDVPLPDNLPASIRSEADRNFAAFVGKYLRDEVAPVRSHRADRSEAPFVELSPFPADSGGRGGPRLRPAFKGMCQFFWSRNGCQKGMHCNFAHSQPRAFKDPAVPKTAADPAAHPAK